MLNVTSFESKISKGKMIPAKKIAYSPLWFWIKNGDFYLGLPCSSTVLFYCCLFSPGLNRLLWRMLLALQGAPKFLLSSTLCACCRAPHSVSLTDSHNTKSIGRLYPSWMSQSLDQWISVSNFLAQCLC